MAELGFDRLCRLAQNAGARITPCDLADAGYGALEQVHVAPGQAGGAELAQEVMAARKLRPG